MVTSLILLNLAGGESVEDLRVLEKDEGLGRVLSRQRHRGCARGSVGLYHEGGARRRRSVPSSSAVFLISV